MAEDKRGCLPSLTEDMVTSQADIRHLPRRAVVGVLLATLVLVTAPLGYLSTAFAQGDFPTLEPRTGELATDDPWLFRDTLLRLLNAEHVEYKDLVASNPELR